MNFTKETRVCELPAVNPRDIVKIMNQMIKLFKLQVYKVETKHIDSRGMDYITTEYEVRYPNEGP